MDVPSVIAGRYRVLRELGRGGMGAVYLVEHVHTGEQLALKVLLGGQALQPEAIERFKREARAPAKIRSENVVRVTDADVAPELGGAPFMVMEALQGKDLDALVRSKGPLAPSEVAWVLGQVASALDKAHAIGIVHRDLKPENLFLHTRDDGTEIVKILDFGISKIRDKEGGEMASAGLTQTGAVMGTPLYMSPEQARGQGASIGPATDIWALGLVTLTLLSGDVYWRAETLADLLMQVMVEPMPPPSVRYPQLGNAFDAWFARSCERDPARRFATVGEQVRAFAAIVQQRPSAQQRTAVLAPQTLLLAPPSQVQTGPAPMSAMGSGPHPQLLSTTGAGAMVRPEAANVAASVTGASTGGSFQAPTPPRSRMLVGLVAFGVLGVAGAVVGGLALHARSSGNASAASAPPSAASTSAPVTSVSATASAEATTTPTTTAAPVASDPIAASAKPAQVTPVHTATAAKPHTTSAPTPTVRPAQTQTQTAPAHTATPGKFNPEAP